MLNDLARAMKALDGKKKPQRPRRLAFTQTRRQSSAISATPATQSDDPCQLCVSKLCVSKLCVCKSCACNSCVSKLYVSKLYVSKLCVSKLCVSKLCV